MHLSDKALLVHLGISQWTARKLDRKASDQVAAANGGSNASGRYNKSLLPTYDKLETVTAKTAVIRKKFYHNTLPWGIEGTFILPSANYLPFVTEFRRDKADWQNAVADFFAGYDAAHQQAKLLLGSLYNSADYPTLAQLQAKFNIGLDILPVRTAGDFRVEHLSRVAPFRQGPDGRQVPNEIGGCLPANRRSGRREDCAGRVVEETQRVGRGVYRRVKFNLQRMNA